MNKDHYREIIRNLMGNEISLSTVAKVSNLNRSSLSSFMNGCDKKMSENTCNRVIDVLKTLRFNEKRSPIYCEFCNNKLIEIISFDDHYIGVCEEHLKLLNILDFSNKNKIDFSKIKSYSRFLSQLPNITNNILNDDSKWKEVLITEVIPNSEKLYKIWIEQHFDS